MIDLCSLLEFEESLLFTFNSDSTNVAKYNNKKHNIETENSMLLLANLENKIDFYKSNNINRGDESISNDTKVDQEQCLNYDLEESLIDNFVHQYHAEHDDFASCNNCGANLKEISSKSHTFDDKYHSLQSCCKQSMKFDNNLALNNLEKSYWKFFINNPTTVLNTLPLYTQFIILKQNGLPNSLRPLIWSKLVLLNFKINNNIKNVSADTDKTREDANYIQQIEIPKTFSLIYLNFQHSYNPEIFDQISKDLRRTFPSIDFFKQEDTIQNLSTILNVYANYDLDLGYCQGLLFLVGVLHYHFKNCQLTFYSLCMIMETETELHEIFTTDLMSSTLNKWLKQFLLILKTVNCNLFNHLIKFENLSVFLYQWWLSFLSSHTPDHSIINKIFDLCLIQGWKVGLMKVSLGLLIVNEPIIMSLDNSLDEEVLFQHLLNETKWGNAVNKLNWFFGELLFSWEDNLFLFDYTNEELDLLTHEFDLDNIISKPSASSNDKLKNDNKRSFFTAVKSLRNNLTLKNSSTMSLYSTNSIGSGLDKQIEDGSQSSLSVFSASHNYYSSRHNSNSSELESIYSTISDQQIMKTSKDTESHKDQSQIKKLEQQNLNLFIENESLKILLNKTVNLLNNFESQTELNEQIESLRNDITNFI